ncbi:F-box only protein 42 [Cichlidogyrus casuarinus]|uniref:F-box only protein 42 n=1 Tax=Cichlidogyrus casuarinus TaxID=1844966 RepID=A0ABD2Q663_9PLAT
MAQFKDLPLELLTRIFDLLTDESDFSSLRRVSNRCNEAVNNVMFIQGRQFYRSFTLDGPLKWSCSKTDGPVPQARFGACLIRNECKIYLFGGSTRDATSFNDLWCFNIISNNWSRIFGTGALPTPRSSVKGAYDQCNLYFYGGFRTRPYSLQGDFPPSVCWTTDLYRFNLKTNQWSKPLLRCADTSIQESSPRKICGQSSTLITTKSCSVFPSVLFLYGGCESSFSSCISDVFLLSFFDSRWLQPKLSVGSPIPEGRIGHACCAISDRQVIVYGGYDHTPTRNVSVNPELFAMQPFNEVWMFSRDNDPNDAISWIDCTWSWTRVSVKNDGPLGSIRDFYHPQAIHIECPFPCALEKASTLAQILFIDQCDPNSLSLSQKMRNHSLQDAESQLNNFLNSRLWSTVNSTTEEMNSRSSILLSVQEKLQILQSCTDKQLKIYILTIDKDYSGLWKIPVCNSFDNAWAPFQRLGFSALFCQRFGLFIFGGFLPTTELNKESIWFDALLIKEWLHWVKRVDEPTRISLSLDKLFKRLTLSSSQMCRNEFITLSPRSLWSYQT